MAGLACGETSPLAWAFLQPSVDFFMTLEDHEAVLAMGRLAAGSGRDIPLVAGESAVAGLAALQRLAESPVDAAAMGLDEGSRVLLISTEGATAPSVFERIVGRSHDAVASQQEEWLKQRVPDGSH